MTPARMRLFEDHLLLHTGIKRRAAAVVRHGLT
jgi:hypothetical protein